MKLRLGLEHDCTVVAVLNPLNKLKLKLGLENVCTVEAALNHVNENRLKLKQDDFEQGRVLERVAQTTVVLAGTYDTHDSMTHGSERNSNARSHNEDSASANNSFWRFSGSYLNHGATCNG